MMTHCSAESKPGSREFIPAEVAPQCRKRPKAYNPHETSAAGAFGGGFSLFWLPDRLRWYLIQHLFAAKLVHSVSFSCEPRNRQIQKIHCDPK